MKIDMIWTLDEKLKNKTEMELDILAGYNIHLEVKENSEKKIVQSQNDGSNWIVPDMVNNHRLRRSPSFRK